MIVTLLISTPVMAVTALSSPLSGILEKRFQKATSALNINYDFPHQLAKQEKIKKITNVHYTFMPFWVQKRF